ncbi:acyl-CoA dehydrogenase [Actinomadura sp. KC345]|uniref:acyl-CoA dehydrogenase family protein n=1 Tax=Actinomadura sp. KC345 TaxID=2530371 RepID=UPI00104996E8|nr:acyl-CoA dehydrogenase family protein [Actinomadura sp. KC345]TDC55617.1 acyl-CoA dehydrogenase [Actinomadura sp. KC345]
MILTFSAEQAELRAVVRRLAQEYSSESDVRAVMDTERGFDPAAWERMADELELIGLAVPEQYGGSGFGVAELTIVLEEMGAALFCAPYLSTVVLAAQALALAGDDLAAEYLPRIVRGNTIATVALPDPIAGRDPRRWPVAAERLHTGWRLSGRQEFVLDGHTADLIIFPASTPAGLSLFTVDADAPGLHRRPMPTLDRTRRQAVIELHDAPGRLLGEPGSAEHVLDRVLDTALIALAAEQVGGAQRCLDAAVAHAKHRHQFGRPIGSFQGIKHKCADMVIAVEFARSAALHAAWCAVNDPAGLRETASLAKATCSEAFVHVAEENIQVHGGMGFTWEHPAHLYYRRAKSSEVLLGSPSLHREMIARKIGLC